MTPSQQAKSMGLKSLTQVRDLHGFNKNGHPLVSLNTLTNWSRGAGSSIQHCVDQINDIENLNNSPV